MKKTVEISTSNIVQFFENHPDYKLNDQDLRKIDWITLSVFSPLSESFISRFNSYLNWEYISKYQKLSKKCIEKHQNLVNWFLVCMHQNLSSNFMNNFIDNIRWDVISKHQKLSKDFILKHMEKLDLAKIRKYQYLPKNFRIKYNNLLGFDEFHVEHESNTLYWTIEQKKKLFEGSPYNIQEDDGGDFIFAYKSVKKNNYSIFNNHYFYKKGKIYTSHCDCDLLNKNSFGLSAWTKEKAKEYGTQALPYTKFKIIKIKIYLKDVGVVIPEHHWKIRAKKIEVI